MTLGEAIRHAEEKAKELREQVDTHIVVDAEEIGDCIECANEHEQLAEWLKHYQQMCKIINEWNADYCYHEHSQKYYFDKLMGTFKEEKNDE